MEAQLNNLPKGAFIPIVAFAGTATLKIKSKQPVIYFTDVSVQNPLIQLVLKFVQKVEIKNFTFAVNELHLKVIHT